MVFPHFTGYFLQDSCTAFLGPAVGPSACDHRNNQLGGDPEQKDKAGKLPCSSPPNKIIYIYIYVYIFRPEYTVIAPSFSFQVNG